MSWRRLLSIMKKELRQMRRDRLTFGMIVGIPIMELILFGFAINMDVRNLDAAVVDHAGTVESRELIAGLGATGVLDFGHQLRDAQAAAELMRRGKINVAVIIPGDLSSRLARRDRPAFQILVDGSDQVIQSAARQLASYPVYGMNGWTQRVAPVQTVSFYNPERKAPLNTVPGLIGVILTMTMVLFTAVALVRERERGNMEMLIATPVSPWELTLGKVLPFVGIGLIQVTVVLLVGHLLFAVPVRGSMFELYLAALIFILASLCLGVLLSTMASNQFQAMQMTFFTFLPQILLSGFMFPYAGMPPMAQWIAECLPLTHFLRLMRGIMLRDAGLVELWQPLAVLCVFVVVFLSVAVSRVKKRLD